MTGKAPTAGLNEIHEFVGSQWWHHGTSDDIMLTKQTGPVIQGPIEHSIAYITTITQFKTYSQTFDISGTKHQNYRLILQLSLPNPLKPGVKRWSSANRQCSNYIWVINNSIAYQGAAYIKGLTVGQHLNTHAHRVSYG